MKNPGFWGPGGSRGRFGGHFGTRGPMERWKLWKRHSCSLPGEAKMEAKIHKKSIQRRFICFSEHFFALLGATGWVLHSEAVFWWIFIDFCYPEGGKIKQNHRTVVQNQCFSVLQKRRVLYPFWLHFGVLFGAFGVLVGPCWPHVPPNSTRRRLKRRSENQCKKKVKKGSTSNPD